MTHTDGGSNDGLTPEAAEEVRQATDRIQRELIIKARLIADVRNSGKVTRHDINLAEETLTNWALSRISDTRKSRFSISLITLASFAAVSLTLLAYWSSGVNKDSSAIAALVSVTGASLGALSAILAKSSLRSQPREPSIESRSIRSARNDQRWELVATWGDIEELLRSATPGYASNTAPIGQILRDYAASHMLGDDFMRDAQQALDARNKIAHGRAKDLSPEDVNSSLDAAARLKSVISERDQAD